MLSTMRRAGLPIAFYLSSLACGADAGVELERRSERLPSPGTVNPDAGIADGGLEAMPDPRQDPPEPPPFVDPGCPPVISRPPIDECNPLGEPSGCPEGESCFPFVDYPAGPCEVERFGTMCMRAGSGTQGDSCAREPCATDHICVSTGRGTLCARLCGLAVDAPDVCSPGLLCLPIDIEGFGGCL
jgi:hypothetical protein